MAGIYIHIPFCAQKCSYCSFFSSVNHSKKDELYLSLLKELRLRKHYIKEENIETIYFGGGTPTIYSPNQIQKIITEIYSIYSIVDNAEITIEANPDDLTIEYLKNLQQTQVNRLSVGIQCFQNHHLKFMNRRHNGDEAIKCIENAKNMGFTNISVDLIYGIPNMTNEEWHENIKTALNLNVQHISSYALTIEDKTLLKHQLDKGKFKVKSDDVIYEEFKTLIYKLKQEGFEHYEISNFSLPNYYSKHNKSYWEQKMYLGIGPGAHSYNLNSRAWNIHSVESYINLIEQDKETYEEEFLTKEDEYNEYIMTSLRTKWGVNRQNLEDKYGRKLLERTDKISRKYMKLNYMTLKNNMYILTDNGVFISNDIISDFFIVE